MKRLISFFSVCVVSLFSAVSLAPVLGINPSIIGVASFIFSFIPLPAGSLYGFAFTAAGGIATPFVYNCRGLCQFITWNDAGNPLTSFRVETAEDGVTVDLLAAGIAVINGFMTVGALAANQVILRIANGYLKNKNVTISGVTAAVGAINFYTSSDTFGTNAFKYCQATIIANNPTVFQNFSSIWVPAMGAAEIVNVIFSSGHKQTYVPAELVAISALYQQVGQIALNNTNAYIHSAEYITGANRVAYIQNVIL